MRVEIWLATRVATRVAIRVATCGEDDVGGDLRGHSAHRKGPSGDLMGVNSHRDRPSGDFLTRNVTTWPDSVTGLATTVAICPVSMRLATGMATSGDDDAGGDLRGWRREREPKLLGEGVDHGVSGPVEVVEHGLALQRREVERVDSGGHV